MNQGGSNRGNRLAVCDSPDRELEAGAINPVILSSAPVSNFQFQISPANAPLGRRASTTVGDVTIRHVYDGIHCAADIDATGTLLRSYTWGPGIDNLLAVTCHSGSSSTTYYALTDIQGTVHGFADASGNLFETYAYDAWGNVLTMLDGNGLPISNQQSQIQNRFLFQGREYSYATGLVNFRLRWYDSATGRWLSKDPIGISGGLNLYAFCGNDPVNYVDPLGLKVVNNSGVTWWVKPENDDDKNYSAKGAYPLKSGCTWDQPQDGISSPHVKPNEVFKNVTGVDIIINSDGSVSTIKDSPREIAGQPVKGGWKGRDWRDGLHDKTPSDDGWDNLFRAAKPRRQIMDAIMRHPR